MFFMVSSIPEKNPPIPPELLPVAGAGAGAAVVTAGAGAGAGVVGVVGVVGVDITLSSCLAFLSLFYSYRIIVIILLIFSGFYLLCIAFYAHWHKRLALGISRIYQINK
jgi:hypothetical protein